MTFCDMTSAVTHHHTHGCEDGDVELVVAMQTIEKDDDGDEFVIVSWHVDRVERRKQYPNDTACAGGRFDIGAPDRYGVPDHPKMTVDEALEKAWFLAQQCASAIFDVRIDLMAGERERLVYADIRWPR